MNRKNTSGNLSVCFFIGTEAELIKVFPVMLQLRDKNVPYRVISSGQNNIANSAVLKAVNSGRLDALLSDHSTIKKSAPGLLQWFIRTSRSGAKRIQSQLRDTDLHRSIMVVHGDTVSTVMGAQLGAKLGMRVAHIEAGLRSFDLLNPFPEEIDRVITSRYARIHYAPGDIPFQNLTKAKGEKVNTHYNTIIDGLKFSQSIPASDAVSRFLEQEFFVFVMHRQENLATKEFVSTVLNRVKNASKHVQCIMIMHKPTEAALASMGLLEELKNISTISPIPRMEYFDFMKLLSHAKFVITDGGSNQEELSYMGKPCLILRKKTERSDGIGKNVLLYGGDVNRIDEFAANYLHYQVAPSFADLSPSQIIADHLAGRLYG